jgi:hypothetical protein
MQLQLLSTVSPEADMPAMREAMATQVRCGGGNAVGFFDSEFVSIADDRITFS